jgi:parallel beta-helix repeat protein
MSDCPVHLTSGAARRLAFAVGVLVCLSLAPRADASASGEPVRCGDTITRDTKLKNDLRNCPSNGVVIGADDITLDLNGHTIDGDGVVGCEELYACDFGVDNSAGHRGVAIKDGSIREFATAVVVIGANHNRLRGLSSSHNILGGVLLIESPGARIERNSISANGLTTDQAGLIVFDSNEIRIERNSVLDNGDIGMFLVGVSDSRVKGNSVSGNPETGIGLDGNGNEVSRNRVSQNGEGITVGGDGNTISRNYVADSRAGVEGGGLGIFVAVGRDNLIERNFVARASRSGIEVSLLPEELEGGPPAEDTMVRRNHLRSNGDGVHVQTTALGTLVQGNLALGATDDGIDVDNATTLVQRNTANHNGDLGIEAVAGVTDLGGNRASGNGNPLQCLNVFCR